jgi:hypothetical protein
MNAIDRRHFLHAGALGVAAATWSPQARAADSEKPADKKPKFRLGLVTYNLAAKWDLPSLLKACQATGVSPVELRTTHKHGVEPSLTKDERADVKKRFADAGVDIWGCGTVCEFQSPDPAVVEKNIDTCKQFVQLVADLGGKGVKVRPNGLPDKADKDEIARTLDRIGKALVPCGKAAEDAGIEIWVEVHGKGTARPPHMKTIMEACGHPKVGLTWNSNPDDVKDGSVAESFALLWPWVRSCHINELYKDAAGVYPYRELFRLFREHGYDRVTMCEVGRTPPDLDSGIELLRYYKALWSELNRP